MYYRPKILLEFFWCPDEDFKKEGDKTSFDPSKCEHYEYCKRHLGETTTTDYFQCPYKYCPHLEEFEVLLN